MIDVPTRSEDNIQFVVENNLCTGCGTCVSVCEEQAIVMDLRKSRGIYVPEIRIDRCIKCGLCVDACAGHSFDMSQFNIESFGKLPPNPLMGNFDKCYIGHATDDGIRAQSSSGGLVTSLLAHALDQGMIDGAIVTRMNGDAPLEPEVFVARNRADLLSAAKSKYCPTPLNTILRWVIENEGRYAIVGLPCHLQGLVKAGKLLPELNKRIVFRFGLVCNHTPSFLAIEYLLHRNGISPAEVREIRFRGNGWPGSMQIELKDGSVRSVGFNSGLYWGLVFQKFFYPRRCATCVDKTCEESDISFMDAWIPELRAETRGHSLIIARTDSANSLLDSAIRFNVVELAKTSEIDVERSQSLEAVLRDRTAMITFLAEKGEAVPAYNREFANVTGLAKMRSRFFRMRIEMSESRNSWTLITLYERLWSIGRMLKQSIRR